MFKKNNSGKVCFLSHWAFVKSKWGNKSNIYKIASHIKNAQEL